jgi:hypothetical protein
MRTKTFALTAALTAAGALTSMAQVYSVNIVGYINLNVPAGFSMIANQLNATPDNTLASVLPAPPENTTIYKFHSTTPVGYQSSNFSVDNPGWTHPEFTLAPGEGAFVSVDPTFAPTGATLTLVGEVQLVSSTPLQQGFAIISSVIPQADTVDNLGFVPGELDTIYRYIPGTGYKSYNYSVDNPGWIPSSPVPAVGESFFLSRQDPSAQATWNRTFTVN